MCTILYDLNAAAEHLYLLDSHGKHSITFVVDVLAYQVHPPCSKTPASCMQTGGTDANGP
jgi:hypothetical protein